MSSTIKILKLLSDVTRLRILHLLQQDALSVVHLQEILGMGQSRISTQLSLLKNAKLVTDTRSGKHNIYQSTLDEAWQNLVAEAAEEIPEIPQDQIALNHLQQKLRDHSRAYFDQLAGQFEKGYMPGRSWKGLAEALLRVISCDVIVDLGAGEGTLAQMLAKRSQKTIAIDLSPKMVEYGQNLAKLHQLPQLEYRVGDIEAPQLPDQFADLAILSQALHHAKNPQRAINAAFALLKPGGRLLILDLLKHHFEEAREWYSDTWLGFSEAEIHQFLKQAGFTKIDISIVDREENPPHFQTLLAFAERPKHPENL